MLTARPPAQRGGMLTGFLVLFKKTKWCACTFLFSILDREERTVNCYYYFLRNFISIALFFAMTNENEVEGEHGQDV
jgi:hypothetical protein